MKSSYRLEELRRLIKKKKKKDKSRFCTLPQHKETLNQKEKQCPVISFLKNLRRWKKNYPPPRCEKPLDSDGHVQLPPQSYVFLEKNIVLMSALSVARPPIPTTFIYQV